MNYWRCITGSRTKKIFSYGATIFFAANAWQTLQMSTLIRMNYLRKPIAGLLFITVNFFQDGSLHWWAVVPAGHFLFGF